MLPQRTGFAQRTGIARTGIAKYSNWHHPVRTGLAERDLGEPSRERQNPAHLAVSGVAWSVLGNTLLGFARDRLAGRNMGPCDLYQTIKAIQ
jgi:hypothetical protein